MDVPSYCNKNIPYLSITLCQKVFAPSVSVIPASSASVSSTTLHKCRSLGLHRPLHNYIAVFVEEAQSLVAVLGVSVVPGGEVILQVHLHISMLGSALPQESVGKVTLCGVLTCDYMFYLRQCREGLSV